MKDTSILDAINAGRRQRKARRKYYVGTSLVLIVVVATGLIVMHPKASPKQLASLTSSTQSSGQGYQYAYLQAVCSGDMSKYNSVIQQVNSETNKLGQLIKEPAWTDNTANLFAAEGVLTTNQNVLDEVSSSEQILQGCLTNVANEQDFTEAEISDINTISSNIPVASTQSVTVANVTLPTYTYTPYNLQTTPADYTSIPAPTTSPVSTNTTTPIAVTYTPTTPTTPTCNEQLKSDDTTEYQANQNSLDDQESAAISAEQVKIGQQGLSGSGIGQQQIDSIQQSYNQQNQQLTAEYQQELASINC